MNPGESKADQQALRDEANAEHRYKYHLAQVEVLAKAMADDATKSEAARAAAAEVEAALRKVEEARVEAANAPTAPEAKRAFWNWITQAHP